MTPELASACVAIGNDPGARHPLDATGFLSEERFHHLLEALSAVGSREWMVGYWDGWSGIEPALREEYGDRLFRLHLPLRDYLAVHTGLDELSGIQAAAHRPFVGPSLAAAKDRSVLVIGDVDWPTTYVGFTNPATRTSVARALENHGVSVDTECNALALLPGYSTANPGGSSA